jgi:hypothetical protein
MNPYTVKVKFADVKVRQSFAHGEGVGQSEFVKRTKNSARHMEMTHQIFNFHPDQDVKVIVKRK